MQKTNGLTKMLAIPAVVIILAMVLNVVGNVMLDLGGVLWYFFVLYTVTALVVMATALQPALHLKLKLFALALLAISIASLPTDISVGLTASRLERDNRIATGGKVKAAGLLVTIIMMYFALALLSFSAFTPNTYAPEHETMLNKHHGTAMHGTTGTGAGTAYNSRTDLPGTQNHVNDGNHLGANGTQRNQNSVVELS